MYVSTIIPIPFSKQFRPCMSLESKSYV